MTKQASYNGVTTSDMYIIKKSIILFYIIMVFYWKINMSKFWFIFYVTSLPNSLLQAECSSITDKSLMGLLLPKQVHYMQKKKEKKGKRNLYFFLCLGSLFSTLPQDSQNCDAQSLRPHRGITRALAKEKKDEKNLALVSPLPVSTRELSLLITS